MPATSEKQAVMMRIAEHAPEKLHSKNKGVLKMSHKQLHEFASTKKSELSNAVKSRKQKGKR